MSDTDGLAAETRRLLDAATKGDWDQVGATVEKEVDVGWCIVVAECDKVADAALIAAAPRLLANWLAREDRPTREAEWVRAVQYGAKVVEQRDAAIAERDRLADENRALREGIEKLIRWAESYRMHHVAIALRDLLAAADRGVTDGDRKEGDER